MIKVPNLKVRLVLHQFADTYKVFPAHELPLFAAKWSTTEFEVVGKTDKSHEIENMDKEIDRMISEHGSQRLSNVFGGNYRDTIEISIEKICKKEKEIDDSKNTAKSKNRTGAETRV
tara:strand:+ start:512 stop:862 length:351 start_codon:yes stop_codon:yes gene_type:complete